MVLDPGHGLPFRGCQNKTKNIAEYQVTRDIAERVAYLLEKRKISVILTRTSDNALNAQDLMQDLSERAHVARQHNANVFVSLHANSGDTKTRGFEFFVPFEENFSKRLAQSYSLASCIHHEFAHRRPQNWIGNLKNLNGFDRGIRQARFNVLAKTPCPAVLIEIDYLTNTNVAAELCDEAHKEAIAHMIADGILHFISGDIG